MEFVAVILVLGLIAVALKVLSLPDPNNKYEEDDW